MSFTKILKGGMFGYLLLSNPQGVAQHFSFTKTVNSNGSSGVINDYNRFDCIDNLPFYDSFHIDHESSEALTDREIEPIDPSSLFESSAARPVSWIDEVFRVASTIYDYIWPREQLKGKLFEAIDKEDLDAVIDLIKKGVNVNCKMPFNFTGLVNGNKNFRCDLGSFGDKEVTPLELAILKGDINVIRALIKAKAKLNETRVINLYYMHQEEIREQEKRHFSDATNKMFYSDALSLLLLSISIEREDIAIELVKSGIDPNPRKSALFFAIEKGFLDLAHELIKAGADINGIIDHKDCLYFAIEKGFFDLAFELIKVGADVNQCCSEDIVIEAILPKEVLPLKDPLAIAIRKKNIQLVKKLLEAKAEVKKEHLRIALNYNNLEIAKELANSSPDLLGELVRHCMYDEEKLDQITKLMTMMDGNLQTYDADILNKELIFRRLLAHAFEISGNTSLMNGKINLSLEGWPFKKLYILYDTNYELTLAFFRDFPEYDKLFDTSKILSALELANLKTTSRRTSSTLKNLNDVDTIIKIIQNPELSFIQNTGWSEHEIEIVFSDNYLIICNRGARPEGQKQIEAYKIDRKTINSQVIKDILELHTTEWLLKLTPDDITTYLYGILPEILQGEKDSVCQLLSSFDHRNQIVGNCAWESMATAMEALIALEILLRNNANEQPDKFWVDKSQEIMIHWKRYVQDSLLSQYTEFHRKYPKIDFDEELYQKATKLNL